MGTRSKIPVPLRLHHFFQYDTGMCGQRFNSYITAHFNFNVSCNLSGFFIAIQRETLSFGILYLRLNKTNQVFIGSIDNPHESAHDESSFNALLIRLH